MRWQHNLFCQYDHPDWRNNPCREYYYSRQLHDHSQDNEHRCRHPYKHNSGQCHDRSSHQYLPCGSSTHCPNPVDRCCKRPGSKFCPGWNDIPHHHAAKSSQHHPYWGQLHRHHACRPYDNRNTINFSLLWWICCCHQYNKFTHPDKCCHPIRNCFCSWHLFDLCNSDFNCCWRENEYHSHRGCSFRPGCNQHNNSIRYHHSIYHRYPRNSRKSISTGDN